MAAYENDELLLSNRAPYCGEIAEIAGHFGRLKCYESLSIFFFRMNIFQEHILLG